MKDSKEIVAKERGGCGSTSANFSISGDLFEDW